MNTNRSMAWLREAGGGIKYPPDRRKVEAELYAHIMDRNKDFLKSGCTEREADESVCTAMGDPVEVRRELAALHRPFWGYAYLSMRILVIGVLLWSLISCLRTNQRLTDAFRPLVDAERFSVSQWLSQSDQVQCGDYAFCLLRAAYAKESESGDPCLLVELSSSTTDPFLGAPRFVSEQVTLIDSRGQTYLVDCGAQHELVFTGRLLLVVRGMEKGADWGVLTLAGPEGPVWLTLRLGEKRT